MKVPESACWRTPDAIPCDIVACCCRLGQAGNASRAWRCAGTNHCQPLPGDWLAALLAKKPVTVPVSAYQHQSGLPLACWVSHSAMLVYQCAKRQLTPNDVFLTASSALPAGQVSTHARQSDLHLSSNATRVAAFSHLHKKGWADHHLLTSQLHE